MHLIPSWIRISILETLERAWNHWTKIVFLILIFEIISHRELKDINVKNESDEKSFLNERKVVQKLSAMHLRKVRWWGKEKWGVWWSWGTQKINAAIDFLTKIWTHDILPEFKFFHTNYYFNIFFALKKKLNSMSWVPIKKPCRNFWRKPANEDQFHLFCCFRKIIHHKCIKLTETILPQVHSLSIRSQHVLP